MGSHSVELQFPGELKVESVRTLMQGWGSNRGSHADEWAMIPLIKFHDELIDGYKKAVDFCLDNAKRWEFAIAVRFTPHELKVVRQPTFEGNPIGLEEFANGVGEQQSPVMINRGSEADRDDVVLVADQIPTFARLKLLDLYAKRQKADEEFGDLASPIVDACESVISALGAAGDAPVAYNDPSSMMGDTLAVAFSAKAEAHAIDVEFQDLLKVWSDKLWKMEDVVHDPKWLVAGWAAN